MTKLLPIAAASTAILSLLAVGDRDCHCYSIPAMIRADFGSDGMPEVVAIINQDGTWSVNSDPKRWVGSKVYKLDPGIRCIIDGLMSGEARLSEHADNRGKVSSNDLKRVYEADPLYHRCKPLLEMWTDAKHEDI